MMDSRTPWQEPHDPTLIEAPTQSTAAVQVAADELAGEQVHDMVADRVALDNLIAASTDVADLEPFTRSASRPAATRTWSAIICGAPDDATMLIVDWLLIAAADAGLVARAVPLGFTSRDPHGMYIELALDPLDGEDALVGCPDDGVDVVIAGDHMELARAMQRGTCDPTRTLVIASTRRRWTQHERSVEAMGVLDERSIDAMVDSLSRGYVAFDGPQVAAWYSLPAASEPGLLIGAAAGAGVLPMAADSLRAAIIRLGVDPRLHLQAARRGMPLGRRQGGRVRRTLTAQQFVRKRSALIARSQRASFELLITTADEQLPGGVQDVVRESIFEITDFQDAELARAYVELVSQACVAVAGRQDADDLAEIAARHLATMLVAPDAAFAAHRRLSRRRLVEIRRAAGLSRDTTYRVIDSIPVEHEPSSIAAVDVERIDATSLRGALRLRRLARGRARRPESARMAACVSAARTYVALLADVARAAPSLVPVVADSGVLVQGGGVVRDATIQTAMSFWGRVVRQSLAIDALAARDGCTIADLVVPHTWRMLRQSGPVALWEIAGSMVGIAMARSRGATDDQAIEMARAVVAA